MKELLAGTGVKLKVRGEVPAAPERLRVPPGGGRPLGTRARRRLSTPSTACGGSAGPGRPGRGSSARPAPGETDERKSMRSRWRDAFGPLEAERGGPARGPAGDKVAWGSVRRRSVPPIRAGSCHRTRPAPPPSLGSALEARAEGRGPHPLPWTGRPPRADARRCEEAVEADAIDPFIDDELHAVDPVPGKTTTHRLISLRRVLARQVVNARDARNAVSRISTP